MPTPQAYYKVCAELDEAKKDASRVEFLISMNAHIKADAEDDGSLPDFHCYGPGPEGEYVEIGIGSDWRQCCDDARQRETKAILDGNAAQLKEDRDAEIGERMRSLRLLMPED